ncbi:F-box protein At3g07870-like isoform X1 [Rhododendron vialii]|uniref:F-box protein At3g07870-like isoform X1 n=1 Tax=Rhododendron vialii TaxID=182163 RepID=UPI0026601533|nr:F-box protein At3g07870-like isoform X1 [Rhododendron vialii]
MMVSLIAPLVGWGPWGSCIEFRVSDSKGCHHILHRMVIGRCKRGRESNSTFEGKEDNKEDEQQSQDHTAASESILGCGILELPMNLIYEILSRLPPKAIICCKCVCKTFLKILTDPYFSEINLIKAPNVCASLILQHSPSSCAFHFVYMQDLEETSAAATCTADDRPFYRRRISCPCQALTVKSTRFELSRRQVTLVGSCNGLLCLYHASWPPFHYICNPVLGEVMVLPNQISAKRAYNYRCHSGFGFCPKTKRYKVVSLMCMQYTDPETRLVSGGKTKAEIYTLGTESWRKIGDAPLPMSEGSFDSFLNGILHWITDGFTAFNLISSFDFEMEQFGSVPGPTHFDRECVNKISWINVGVLGEFLSLCYVIGDGQFDVWVMKDYGVKESWTREFVIDINFYCALEHYLHQPIAFLRNGDLLFIWNSRSLVSYNHRKGTFREFKAFGPCGVRAIAHIPSFISLKGFARGGLLKTSKWRGLMGGMNFYTHM